ncbi:MAG: helix-turn-helix domain-containing protein [Phormidesmis sp. CAN_BIN44]|nr:helix-turn-helix domain-containing protein [Phormidesmis sp. CAN_BIN44]
MVIEKILSPSFPPAKVATATSLPSAEETSLDKLQGQSFPDQETAAPQPLTYYPLTQTECAVLFDLPIRPSALSLLLYIKARAPFGRPVRFTDFFNLETIAAALKFKRTKFWRAKKELVDKGLIELSNYCVRDCHTVNRQQFEDHRRAKSAEANVSEIPPLVPPVADLQRSLQICNDRSLEPNQGKGSDDCKQINISSNLNIRTTEHSRIPTAHPEGCFSVNSSEIGGTDQNDTVKRIPKRKQDFEAKSVAQNPASAESFLQFKPNLRDLGITALNKNLLETFQAAGVDQVRVAIAHVARKVQDSPGRIKNVTGYLVRVIENGENLLDIEDQPKPIPQEALDWVDEGRKADKILYSKGDTEADGMLVVFSNNTTLPWREAMGKYPTFD